MTPGEIWLVEFTNAKGHEQAGSRPAILISDKIVNIHIIIPLTSNQLANRFPYTLKIKASKLNGLSADSVALIFQLRAIDKRRLIQKIGTLEASLMKNIKSAIKEIVMI